MKHFTGTFGLSYGNWGAILNEKSGEILFFDSRNNGGINIERISLEKLQREIKKENLAKYPSCGYLNEAINNFIESFPKDGFYKFDLFNKTS